MKNSHELNDKTELKTLHHQYVQHIFDFQSQVSRQVESPTVEKQIASSFIKDVFSQNTSIIFERIGDPSGNSVVYKLNNNWIVKVNQVIDGDFRSVFMSNVKKLCAIVYDDRELKNLLHGESKNLLHGESDLGENYYASISLPRYIFDFRHDIYTIYLVFEKFINGYSLASLLDQKKKSPSETEFNIDTMLYKIKNTLQFLHKKLNFYHNDLHCGNIMIKKKTNHPVICDYDWAMFNGNNNENVRLCNIFSYMYKTNEGIKTFLKRYPNMNPKSNSEKYFTQLNCETSIGWFLLHKAFSVLGKGKEPNLNRYSDMIILLDDLIPRYNARFNPCIFQKRLGNLQYIKELLNISPTVNAMNTS